MKQIILSILIMFFYFSILAQTNGSFKDPRDGQIYKTITINDPLKGTVSTWMAENLNYKFSNSKAYNNDESFRNGVGLLYNWEDAMQACPVGWHLPSEEEFQVLVDNFEEMSKPAQALKSSSGWSRGNGTNSSGFNALPAGWYTHISGFYNLRLYCYFWTSTIYNEPNPADAYMITITFHDHLLSGPENTNTYASVRCIKN